jgi:hypothetical protein
MSVGDFCRNGMTCTSVGLLLECDVTCPCVEFLSGWDMMTCTSVGLLLECDVTCPSVGFLSDWGMMTCTSVELVSVHQWNLSLYGCGNFF